MWESCGPCEDALARALRLPYGTGVALHTGLMGRASCRVREEDTASALHSGDVPVLGTPRLVALCEEATCQALQGELDARQTTVATRVRIDHLAPASVGREIAAEATLESVEGRRLTFTVSASDEAGIIGAGRITRVLVDAEKFLARAR